MNLDDYKVVSISQPAGRLGSRDPRDSGLLRSHGDERRSRIRKNLADGGYGAKVTYRDVAKPV